MGSIHCDIVSTAQQCGNATALWSADGSLSYGELDRRSACLSAWLRLHEISAGSRVGVMLGRTADAVVAILAVLRSGAAYVPLDPLWPANRTERIAADSDLRALIFGGKGQVPGCGIPHIMVHGSPEWSAAMQVSPCPEEQKEVCSDSDLAYILYTSGSTGQPKGVCISHRAASYFAVWAKTEFDVCPNDRIAAVSPFTSDLSTFELFAGLSAGATVYIMPEAVKGLPAQASEFLQRHSITILYAVPTMLRLLAARGVLARRCLDSMRLVMFAGEVYRPTEFQRLANQLPPHVEYANLYGPTETNVCTWHRFRSPVVSDGVIPIGRPLPGTHVFTLPSGNADRQPSSGELCVVGPGVMSGYWGEADDRSETWALQPGAAGQRAYRTGDTCRCRLDGQWIFVGRTDGQIKLGGYRIEPCEIEARLAECPGVLLSAVVKSSGSALGEFLLALVVPGGGLDVDAVRRHCQKNLPSYMVPREIKAVDHIPLTHSGKIDRRELARMARE